mgnify:CR=1 FL=1
MFVFMGNGKTLLPVNIMMLTIDKYNKHGVIVNQGVFYRQTQKNGKTVPSLGQKVS